MSKQDEFTQDLGLPTAPAGRMPEQPVPPKLPKIAKGKSYYTIVIEEEDGGLNYLPVGVNGLVYQIMRGVEVEVPAEVVDVLANAVATRIVTEKLPDGRTVQSARNYNTIPYRILSGPRTK